MKRILPRLCSVLLTVVITLTLFSGMQKANAANLYGAGRVAITSGVLNVRKSASTSSAVVSTLKKNAYVTLVSKSGSFWRVKYSASSYGYCSAAYITAVSKAVKTVVTSSGNLNVRSAASTSSSKVASLSPGTVVPVISTSGNWSRIIYNGIKTGYVSSSYLKTASAGTGTSTPSTYKAISLSVPSYKQADSRWSSVTLGSSGQTIGRIGCATTALSMTESFRTRTTIYPNAMAKKLSYTSGGAVYWPSNYTITTSSSGYLAKVYSLLNSGKPVIIGSKNASGGQHYVVVTGVKACTTLSTSCFYINDPGSNSRTTLSQFFASYPYFYKMLNY